MNTKSKYPSLVGQTFHRLTVIRQFPGGKKGTQIECRCSCGKLAIVQAYRAINGKIQSCGCLKAEFKNAYRHGHARSPTYIAWTNMQQRCCNSKRWSYKYYGGRGIVVCERWRIFENFLADMGARPSPEHEVDRIDNDGNYEPVNCRWATRREQQNNTSSNRRITYRNETLTLTQWARRAGLRPTLVRCRLKEGWTFEDAITWQPIPPGLTRDKAARRWVWLGVEVKEQPAPSVFRFSGTKEKK